MPAKPERPKQHKNPWTSEEQKLFLEALDLHGPKGKTLHTIYCRLLANFGTRRHSNSGLNPLSFAKAFVEKVAVT